jgi:hypothetical protein
VLRRARSLGYTIAHDAALRLRVGAQCIAPRLVAGGLHRFAIPAGAVEATILSRAGVPAEIEAGGRDHRRLGVMVEHIVLRRPGWRRHVRLDLLPEGQGWHAAEREGARQWRWTDGRARLDLAGAAADGRLLLDLHIGAVQPSWRQRGTDDVGFGNGVDHRRAS